MFTTVLTLYILHFSKNVNNVNNVGLEPSGGDLPAKASTPEASLKTIGYTR